MKKLSFKNSKATTKRINRILQDSLDPKILSIKSDFNFEFRKYDLEKFNEIYIGASKQKLEQEMKSRISSIKKSMLTEARGYIWDKSEYDEIAKYQKEKNNIDMPPYSSMKVGYTGKPIKTSFVTYKDHLSDFRFSIPVTVYMVDSSDFSKIKKIDTTFNIKKR